MNTQGASLPCAQEAHLCLPLLWLVPPLTGQASYLQSEEENPDGPRSLSRSLPITHCSLGSRKGQEILASFEEKGKSE